MDISVTLYTCVLLVPTYEDVVEQNLHFNCKKGFVEYTHVGEYVEYWYTIVLLLQPESTHQVFVIRLHVTNPLGCEWV